jgi:glycosyltransferase involved in cell wall biosynthesis
MENRELSKPVVVFDFKHSPEGRIREVEMGEAPKESLLGFIQLRERGWDVKSSHGRWGQFGGGARRRFSEYVEIPSIEMIREWNRADVVVVVSRLSFILSVVGRVLGKKMFFLDAIQQVPKKPWRRLIAKLAIHLSNGVICFSRTQAAEWAEAFQIPLKKFLVLPYSVELSYYAPYRSYGGDPSGYLLSVGRDQEREFETLVKAAEELDRKVVLVTHRYLVANDVLNNPRVKLLQDISYVDLFSIYEKASLTIVPIRKGVSYMSGIRASMESILVGVPVVSASTAGLREYFSDGEQVIFYEPENVDSLVSAIKSVEAIGREALSKRAIDFVSKENRLDDYVDSLEKIFTGTSGSVAGEFC